MSSDLEGNLKASHTPLGGNRLVQREALAGDKQSSALGLDETRDSPSQPTTTKTLGVRLRCQTENPDTAPRSRLCRAGDRLSVCPSGCLVCLLVMTLSYTN